MKPSDGQSRVLVLLILAAVLAMAKNGFQWVKGTKANLQAKSTNPTTPLFNNAGAVVVWALAALIVYGLAGPAPVIMTWFMVLILMLLLFSDVELYTGIVGKAVHKTVKTPTAKATP